MNSTVPLVKCPYLDTERSFCKSEDAHVPVLGCLSSAPEVCLHLAWPRRGRVARGTVVPRVSCVHRVSLGVRGTRAGLERLDIQAYPRSLADRGPRWVQQLRSLVACAFLQVEKRLGKSRDPPCPSASPVSHQHCCGPAGP